MLDPRKQTAGDIKELMEIGRECMIAGENKGFQFLAYLNRAAIEVIGPDQAIDYGKFGAEFKYLMSEAQETG
jgi:hypothetical protein